jgi:glycosyltransferase involved in cell wall biosynthesis
MLGCRVIMHLHGANFRNWYRKRSQLIRLLVQKVLDQASAMIVLSASFKSIFERLLPINKLFVVPNGIERISAKGNDIEIFQKSESVGQITVLYLGTLTKNKGIFPFIKSIPLVANRHNGIRFVIAGPWFEESDKEKGENFVKANKLGNVVNFIGPVEEQIKWHILENSDIFVFPGIMQEGQPLVVLEAMAAGLPILYTDRGCLKEMIQDGVNGFQIRINNPLDLAEKILTLANDPNLINDMGKRNLLKYQSQFTSKHYIKNMIEVFNKVCES